jgi:hypothetical protein
VALDDLSERACAPAAGEIAPVQAPPYFVVVDRALRELSLLASIRIQ